MNIKTTKELIEKLSYYPEDMRLYFEVEGHNQGGEFELFPLSIKGVKLTSKKELTITMEDV